MNLKILITGMLVLSSIIALNAQSSVNATGGDATGTGGSASYSVGQLVFETHTGSNGSVAEGVQQAYEISIVTSLEEAKGISLLVSAYPNPTRDYLTLEVNDIELSNLKYQLYDMNGKLLQSEDISSNLTSIFMSSLAPANYFMKVIQGSKELKTFKIIKQ